MIYSFIKNKNFSGFYFKNIRAKIKTQKFYFIIILFKLNILNIYVYSNFSIMLTNFIHVQVSFTFKFLLSLTLNIVISNFNNIYILIFWNYLSWLLSIILNLLSKLLDSLQIIISIVYIFSFYLIWFQLIIDKFKIKLLVFIFLICFLNISINIAK